MARISIHPALPAFLLLAAGLLGAALSGCSGRGGDGGAAQDSSAVNGAVQGERPSTDGAAKSDPTKQRFHCPMHPTYISDRMGDCPICGMRLVPIVEGSETETDASMEGSAVAGMVPIKVTGQGVHLAGVVTEPATFEKIERSIRTVAQVTPDESRVRRVQTKVTGWIEKLYVNTTGGTVRRGEPVLTLYSPELLATQEEFLRALETAKALSASSSEDVRSGGADMLEATRRRLLLFDVSEAFIEELERTGKPSRTVTLSAPVSGFITAKEVFEGQQVSPGMELFTVTDLSRVWVEANVYEYDAAAARVGQEVELTLPYDPGVYRKGKVELVYPELDRDSRSLRVRLVFDNPDLALKPGMYANVNLNLVTEEGITIPDNAILETGDRQVVFVRTSAERFEPREILVGIRGRGRALVLSGLEEGEEVVVRANFLLDSESRLRSALSGAKHGDHP